MNAKSWGLTHTFALTSWVVTEVCRVESVRGLHDD